MPRRVVALACVPPALAGALLRGPIERRLGTPATIAVAPRRRRRWRWRSPSALAAGAPRADAGLADGLALGGAQALALIPGVSRSGAARAVARMRGFDPREAQALSDAVGLPITLGAVASSAGAVEGRRSRRRSPAGPPPRSRRRSRAGRCCAAPAPRGSLYPFAVYRIALAAAVVRRLRENGPR